MQKTSFESHAEFPWYETKKNVIFQIHQYPNFHFYVIKTTFSILLSIYARLEQYTLEALFAIKNSYFHLSNSCGGWNKDVGVQKLQNRPDFFLQFLNRTKIYGSK